MNENQRVCFNIDAADDPFFINKTSCLPFTRSDTICTEGSIRQQFNSISAFIDASNIYGSDFETSQALRNLHDGKGTLKSHVLGPLLPTRLQAGLDSDQGRDQDPQELWQEM